VSEDSADAQSEPGQLEQVVGESEFSLTLWMMKWLLVIFLAVDGTWMTIRSWRWSDPGITATADVSVSASFLVAAPCVLIALFRRRILWALVVAGFTFTALVLPRFATSVRYEMTADALSQHSRALADGRQPTGFEWDGNSYAVGYRDKNGCVSHTSVESLERVTSLAAPLAQSSCSDGSR
jgi:hypothetical protein